VAGVVQRSQPGAAGEEKLINEARRDYNKVIRWRRVRRNQRIREADGIPAQRESMKRKAMRSIHRLVTEYIKAPVVPAAHLHRDLCRT